jgi:hypothetical protein
MSPSSASGEITLHLLSHIAPRFRQIEARHLATSDIPPVLADVHGTITKLATW